MSLPLRFSKRGVSRLTRAHVFDVPFAPSSSAVRKQSFKTLYSYVFATNANYLTLTVLMAITTELAYDGGFNSLWTYLNKGKIYSDMIKNWPKEEE